MNIKLTNENLAFMEKARDYVNTNVLPYAKENDKNECVSEHVIEKLKDSGYLGSMIPEEFGGMGLDNINICILNEELGRGCSSVKGLITVHGMAALGILRWGTEEQQNYYLRKMTKGEMLGAFAISEPNVGSDVKSIESIAVSTDGHFKINGKKKWITMGQIADFFLLLANCESQPTAFIVEKDSPGLMVTPMKGLLGARASMIAELTLEDCIIPEKNLLGRIGTGLSHVALSCLDYGRYTIACGCVGIAQACLEASVQYARSRKQFGMPLRKNQLIQKMIAEMSVNIKAARLLCMNAGCLKDAGDPDSIMEVWNAKYFASTILSKIVNDTVQIYGANGCIQDNDVERYYRDAKINQIIEGTTQMHEILIAMDTFRSIH